MWSTVQKIKKQTVSFMGIIDLFQKLPFEITNSDTLISNQFTRIDGFIEYSIIFKLILLFKPYQFNMYFLRGRIQNCIFHYLFNIT